VLQVRTAVPYKIGMTRWIALALFAIGCAPDGYTLTPTYGLDPTIADLAVQAIDMWETATGGAFAPDVHVGCDGSEDYCIKGVRAPMTQCAELHADTPLRGCTIRQRHEIRISLSMRGDERLSTIEHEIGHSLGLAHAEVGLMSTTRTHEGRVAACIDADTLEAFADAYASQIGNADANLHAVCAQ